jgi:hypothetical protein
MRRMIQVLTAAGCLMGGCGNVTSEAPPVVRACTKIGCSSGLAIEVNTSLQQAFTVNVRSGTQVIHTFRCEPGQPCRSFAENQTPATVTVTVESASGPVSKQFTPEYRINRPNGPDCPPDCRQATVTLTVT